MNEPNSGVGTLVDALVGAGVALWVEHGRLAWLGPEEELLPDLYQQLRLRTDEVTAFLQDEAPPATSPLSYAQQGLWLVHELAPDSAAYNVNTVLDVDPAVDVPALERAVELLVERHRSLRTIYRTVHGRAVQQVRDDIVAPLEVIDTRTSGPELDLELARLIDRPIDLAGNGPFRVSLIRSRAGGDREAPVDRGLLVLVVHHIAADLASLEILVRELDVLYGAARLQAPAELPELPFDYDEHTTRERERLESEAGDRLWAYWQAQLKGELRPLALPADFARPRVQTYRGETFAADVDETLTAALSEVARRHHTTRFVLLYAAFVVLLRRYTGQSDIVVASPITLRNEPDSDLVVGDFVNPVALRVSVASQEPFERLLQRAAAVVTDAVRHADFPFPLLVERLAPVREASRSPVAQVLYNWNKLDPDIAGWRQRGALVREILRGSSTGAGGATHDLALTVTEFARTLRCGWTFNSDLFTRATIETMAGDFTSLLESIAAAPERTIAGYELPSGRWQADAGWGRGVDAAVPRACVHELVEQQARRTPHAIAVIDRDGAMTYAELQQRSEAVAAYLRASQVGLHDVVAVCVGRTASAVALFLGILRCGACYVPLDPGFPEDRLRFIVGDAGLSLLISDGRVQIGDLPVWDGHQGLTAVSGDDAPTVASDPATLAYIIYTSGSTGWPKGVAVEHGALSNFLHSMSRKPGLSPEDRLCAVTTFSFDIAGLELFLPLITGAAVVLADEDTVVDGAALAALLVRERATVMQATPATWRLLLDAGWAGAPGVRLLCGGEALSADLAEALCRCSAEVWNLYGPTETTIWVSTHRVEPDAARNRSGTVPIGTPIDNTTFDVLDEDGLHVPPGVAGELWIGGRNLARGYWRRPELTAEKFVAAPDGSGTRYRSGDLVRWRDGALEYLGRLDAQVKVRGFRIEPGEIEAVLREHPSVKDAVVIARREEGAEALLVAYVVAPDAAAIELELLEAMRRRLPSYMIPSFVIGLDAFPLTPNGKLDRGALPVPRRSLHFATEYAAPRTETERQVAETWSEALGRDRIGVDDNFFEIGGYSLIAAQAAALSQARMSPGFAVKDLFDHQTIATLSAWIDTTAGRSPSMVTEPALARTTP